MTNKEKLKKEVNDAWENLIHCENELGKDHSATATARAKWYGLDMAWNIIFDGEGY